MSESREIFGKIRKHIKGPSLLLGREIERPEFAGLNETKRINVRRKEPFPFEKIGNLTPKSFNTVILHRLLYRRDLKKKHMSDPDEILRGIKKIIASNGKLIVNSHVLGQASEGFRNSRRKIMLQPEQMVDLLNKHFRKIKSVQTEDGNFFFICKEPLISD